MICQNCKKRFKKKDLAHIWKDNKYLEVCQNCFRNIKNPPKPLLGWMVNALKNETKKRKRRNN